jgi:hypothetical protein
MTDENLPLQLGSETLDVYSFILVKLPIQNVVACLVLLRGPGQLSIWIGLPDSLQ